jgi:hypothetical protein
MSHSLAIDTVVRSTAAIDTQAVRRRAHERWQERGCPVGNPERDWLEAERELQAKSERAGTRVVSSAQGSVGAVAEALTARGGRRAPRTITTRTESALTGRLLAALVPRLQRTDG